MNEKTARFQARERVAEGRTVVVSRAYDQESGREVALKTLRDDHCTFPERVAAFSASSKLAARLLSAHLVPVIAARRQGSRIFVASPWVSGLRLSELPMPMAPEMVAGIVSQMADGMATAHVGGVLLRGLNPRDIYVRSDGHVMLVDLNKVQAPGPCGVLPPMHTRGEVLRYLPMEARASAQVDAKTDIFCLGALGLELLTGVAPTIEGAVDMKPGVVQALTAQGIRGQLAKLCMALASPRPDQRPSSVANVPHQTAAFWSAAGAGSDKAAVAAGLGGMGTAPSRATPVMTPAANAPRTAAGPKTATPLAVPAPPAPAASWAQNAEPPQATAEEDELLQFFEENTSPIERDRVRAALDDTPPPAEPAPDPWGLRSQGRFRSLQPEEVSAEGDQSGFAYVNDSGRVNLGQPEQPNLDRTRTQRVPAVAPKPKG